jgi:hypothetical protein
MLLRLNPREAFLGDYYFFCAAAHFQGARYDLGLRYAREAHPARCALRPAALWRGDRLRVSQGQARLRTIPDRGPHQPAHSDLAATLPLEPAGSRVIRGVLHVIPIDNSILYVSPLYLRAETGQIPELKRVIAAYGDQVVMEETLAEALAVLFKEATVTSPHAGASAGTSLAAPESDRAREALGHYNRAMEHLKAGDWSGFGAELDKLRSILEESSQRSSGR